ncbi:hypothetical protein ScPMuIL_012533 [Solemya velum]
MFLTLSNFHPRRRADRRNPFPCGKMSFFASMKKWMIVHLLLGYVFLLSGVIVNILMLCSLVLWPFNKTLYRRINYYLAYSHWCELCALCAWWSNSDCILYVEPEDLKHVGKEHTVCLSNHGYEIDFLMFFILCERLHMLGGSKIYGKDILKFAPILGLEWYSTESIFLKRDWAKDKEIIQNYTKQMAAYPADLVSSLLFCPEGTRFTPEKHKTSLEISRKKGYPELKHLLLPRSKGFYVSMLGMKGKHAFPTVLDMTLAFRKDQPDPTFWDVVNGKQILGHLKIRRISINSVPTDTEEECAEWMRQLFVEKDKCLDYFSEHGCFEGSSVRLPRRLNDLIISLFWVAITCLPLIYYSGKIFWSGTIIQQLVFLSVTVFLSYVVRLLIGITEKSKGSKYGVQTVNNEEKTK